jgi:hypothetical protein
MRSWSSTVAMPRAGTATRPTTNASSRSGLPTPRIDVGGGRELVLSSDYDDGTLEVFRVGHDKLLLVGIRYADGVEYGRFLRDVLTLELDAEGMLEVRCPPAGSSCSDGKSTGRLTA